MLGYKAETTPTGTFIITLEDGGDIDTGEFVPYPIYFNKRKRDYPNLKVSRPVEDICNLCYMFVHRHKFFADHTMRPTHKEDHDYDDEDKEDQDMWMNLPAI